MQADERASLRHILKRRTTHLHEALDLRLGRLAAGSHFELGQFLSIQLSARLPIEAWLDDHLPEPLRPPAQSPLIAADLAALGFTPRETKAGFVPTDSREALGIAWAIAGSSLGNRAILALGRKSQGDIASSFLSDPAMPRFWKELLPLLTAPSSLAESRAPVAGASRVFQAFLDCCEMHRVPVAA